MPFTPTYSPVPHVPAPHLRDADGSMRQAPRRSAGYAATHPVQPLKGLPGTRATDVSYRALAPGGAGFCYRICTGTSEARPTAHYSLLTANSSYTFSAKEKDSETGLSYFGSRYYSSNLSVWLSVDPMSDDYPYQSNYVYCSNNPLMIVDPNGMFETRAEAQKYRKEHHTGGSILLLASDDWTGFGIADDIFIPVVIVAGTAAYGELCFSLMLERNKVPANLNVTDMIGNIIKGASIVRIIRIGERVPMKEKIKVK